MTRARTVLLGMALAALTGCQTPAKQEFDQVEANVDLRRLYEPLATTDPELLERLESLNGDHIAFALSPDGAKGLDAGLPDEALWSDQRAVFYRVDADNGSTEWLYFGGATLRVQTVTPPYPVDGDLIASNDGGFSIYRSIPVRKGGVKSIGDLEVFRFDFAVDAAGSIAPTGHQRLTTTSGADMQPVAIVGTDRVVYVHQDEDGPHELRVADTNGGPARPLFPGQKFDSVLPAMLSDGRLVFLTDELGHYSLFQLADAANYAMALERSRTKEGPEPDWRGQVKPLEYPIPAPRAKSGLFVASVPRDGKLVPAILEVPNELDLPTIAQLVEAHNPRVNELRARYAASLMDAARYKLRNYPTIDFGLTYEDHISIFNGTPALFPADTLTQHALTFVLGLTQPLLDFKQNQALTQSALEDAETARHSLDSEINARVTEAAELYFEAAHLSREIAIEDAQLALTEQRDQFYRTLRSKGEATRLQLMAVQQVRDGLQSERAYHTERVAFLVNRLKEVMGLPSDSEFAIAPARYALDEYAVPPLEQVTDRALSNHPNLLAAKSATASAFYQQAAGPDIRPRASAGAAYERTDSEYLLGQTTGNVERDRAQEMATLALSGQIPLASWRAKKVHNGFWTAMISALELAQEAEARRVRTAMEEAYVDFRAAQRDFAAKASTQSFQLEKVRVARLHKELGPPSAPISVLRPPDEPGAVEETLGTGVLAPLSAQYEYLRAVDRRSVAEMDLGIRFAHVAREMGDRRVLLDALETHGRGRAARMRPAVWLWNSRDVLADENSLDAAADRLKAEYARRVYVYLQDEAKLLDNRMSREHLTQFIGACARRDIEVFALLGEPEWIPANNADAVKRAMTRITKYNASFGAMEPAIAGVKLDLEPHAQPGWTQGGAARAALESNYLGLLKAAREGLAGAAPLWADLPVQFFRPEQKALLDGVMAQIDGATLMDYFNAENPIATWADTALRTFDEKPLEIGIELSPRAPAEDSLAGWPAERIAALRKTLNETLSAYGNFAGIALHDYEALTPTTETK